MADSNYRVRTLPENWTAFHTPAAATQATISRAANATLRHFCASICVIISAVGAQAGIQVNLRDGASGAGTILWSETVALPAGGIAILSLSGLNIPGTKNTAMTLEVSGAPAATNFASVSMTGYDGL